MEYINKRNIRLLTERIKKLEKKVKYLEEDKKVNSLTGEWK
tara:strand:+ start:383 stop:505 length:123 start_codon:yes stop_codon:yes gene_type:complete